MPSFFAALLVSTSATGIPLMRNITSARFVCCPLVYCHSSVTWKRLLAGWPKSTTRTLRWRFSASTKTDRSPRSHARTSAFPSMLVRTASIRAITASALSSVRTPGFSAISFSRSVGYSSVPLSPRRRLRASSGSRCAQPTWVTYRIRGSWTVLRSPAKLAGMDQTLGPADELLGELHGLSVLRLGDRVRVPRVSSCGRVIREAVGSRDRLGKGYLLASQESEQLADVVGAGEVDPAQDQNRFDGLLDRLLGVEGEVLPERFRGLGLLGQGEVAPRVTQPVASEFPRARVRRHTGRGLPGALACSRSRPSARRAPPPPRSRRRRPCRARGPSAPERG